MGSLTANKIAHSYIFKAEPIGQSGWIEKPLAESGNGRAAVQGNLLSVFTQGLKTI